jgi:hypothetical protein
VKRLDASIGLVCALDARRDILRALSARERLVMI